VDSKVGISSSTRMSRRIESHVQEKQCKALQSLQLGSTHVSELSSYMLEMIRPLLELPHP
jgi:hypothetical protein